MFGIPLLAANVTRHRWRSPETSSCRVARLPFLIDEDNHPYAHSAAVPEQWSAVDPAWSAFAFTILVGVREPTDLSRDATAFTESGTQVGTDAAAATDAVKEGRLKDARDAQRR